MNRTGTNMPQEHQPEPGQMGHWAPYYDAFMKVFTLGLEPWLRRWTIRKACVQSGDRVLETGCGTGTLTIAAKRQAGSGGEVHGIDAAPEMIERATRKARRAGLDIDFRVGFIQEIPFPDARFDVVLASFMIYHMSEATRRQGVAEIRRVLRPGGRLFVLDGAPTGEPQHQGLVALLEHAGFRAIEVGRTWFRLSFVQAQA